MCELAQTLRIPKDETPPVVSFLARRCCETTGLAKGRPLGESNSLSSCLMLSVVLSYSSSVDISVSV